MTIVLRDYQVEAVEAVINAWNEQVYPPPAVELPTGSGKSVTMAEVVRRVKESGREGKIIVLAHRGELLRQLRKAVRQIAPDITVGILKANRREYEADVIVASVQTLASSARHFVEIGEIAAVLVDECHHYVAETYKGVLSDLGCHDLIDPTPTVGFTATMWHSKGGLDLVWTTVFQKSLLWAIEHGFLVRPKGLVVVTDTIDLSNVRVEAGDYVRSELEEAMMASVGSTVTAMQTYCSDKACIVFAAGVEHARKLAEKLTESGMPAEIVVGSMSMEERQDIYDRYNSGELHSMVTVTVLTEGADFPRCECVVMARPTQSKSLHSQQVGRALRLYTDPVTGKEKSEALVLDLAGHTRKMSLMDLSKIDDAFNVDFVSPEGEDVAPPEDEEPKGVRPRNQRLGVLQVEEVDLFDPKVGKRVPRWLKTRAGTMFLPGMHKYVFLRQNDAGIWYVGWATTSGMIQGRYVSEHGDKKEAVTAAESFARSVGDLPMRTKSQFTNIAPTEKQIQFATNLGIKQPETLTKARLQDEISQTLALRRLDQVYA